MRATRALQFRGPLQAAEKISHIWEFTRPACWAVHCESDCERDDFFPTAATAPLPARRVTSDDAERPTLKRETAPRRLRPIHRGRLAPVCGAPSVCALLVRACPERQKGAQLVLTLSRWSITGVYAGMYTGRP